MEDINLQLERIIEKLISNPNPSQQPLKEAYSELLSFGKEAVPYLLGRFLSEDKIDTICRPSSPVVSFLGRHGDIDIARSLIGHFQEKVKKYVETDKDLYLCQVWSIANYWEKYPVNDAVPVIEETLAMKRNDNEHVFCVYIREALFNSLCRIATEDSVHIVLEAGNEASKNEELETYKLVGKVLETNVKSVGSILYDAYRSTPNQEVRKITSSALGLAKCVYWVKRMFS